MNKAESYCYIIKDHLKRGKARICLYYGIHRQSPRKRIEVQKTGDLTKDLRKLKKCVQDELIRGRAVIEKEKEVVNNHRNPSITIDKYFICVQ